jgi:hypothetical protein
MQNTPEQPAMGNLMSSKWDVLYIKLTGFLRRIQFWKQFLCICLIAPAMAILMPGAWGEHYLILPKYHVCYTKMTAIWRRIQIWNGNSIKFCQFPFIAIIYNRVYKIWNFLKRLFFYIKLSTILRRIQIWRQFLQTFSIADSTAIPMPGMEEEIMWSY